MMPGVGRIGHRAKNIFHKRLISLKNPNKINFYNLTADIKQIWKIQTH